jgi:hypothetical protein
MKLLWLCCALTLNGCVVADVAMETQVMQYSGDGVIHNASLTFWPGYRIEFPAFDATRAFEASYRLSHVPQLDSRDPLIYLRFYQRDFITARKKKNSVTASFHVALSDAQGHILHSAEISLSTSWWTGNQRLFGVYDLEKSKLHFDRGASYVLHVAYKPGRVPPPAKQLYFSIENGGTK